jgi:hypothetical protein
MSIGYLLYADIVITKEELLTAIEESGSAVNRDGVTELVNGFEISEFIDTIGVVITLTKTNVDKFPFGQHDSCFLQNGFQQLSYLDFWIDKQKNYEQAPVIDAFVLSVVFNLMNRLDCYAILESHNSEELCLFTPSEVIVNNSDDTWNYPQFSEVLQGVNHRLFNGVPLKK